MLRIELYQWIAHSLRAFAFVFALVVPITAVHAANETINWGFSPTPASVAISVGNTVTWSGSLSSHPLMSTNASFAQSGTPLASVGTSYTQLFNTAGTYYFVCANHGVMRTTVTVSGGCAAPPGAIAALDIDGNGQVDALTDGLLVLRYLLGLRGNTLIAGAVGANASRCTSLAIEGYLASRVVP